MSTLRSGPLAAWTCAWMTGAVSLDQVVDAVTDDDAPHSVAGLAGFEGEPVGLREVLVAWRKSAARVVAVLPAAGDVRGVPGPTAFRSAALEAGEAAYAGGLGIVPEVVEHAPSSAPATVVWQAFATEPAPPDPLSLADAQYELTTAIRESASALTAAEVSGTMADIADALHDARRAGEHLNLPPGFPPRAVTLLAQAERLQAALDLALTDPAGGAVDRTGIAARTEALRPLAVAVRRARLAGYNAWPGA
ncbi:MAG TPA: hypothetical protein VFH38_04140 [Jatrophihabitans sp.]|nr:hypothetical protein [Jatrophihabitans sp.]